MAIASGSDILGTDVSPFRQVQTGSISISFASAASNVSSVITFPVPFASAPVVPPPNIDSAPGATSHWVCRAINITSTGFQIFSFSGDGILAVFSAITISWVAISRT
jgi:hypothetical protein